MFGVILGIGFGGLASCGTDSGQGSAADPGSPPADTPEAIARLTFESGPLRPLIAEAAPAVEGTTTAEDAALVDHTLAFSPCVEDPTLECGQLSVPLAYTNPRGPQISLATVRAPALAPNKQGIIFVNPGGPGDSGVDFVLRAKLLLAPLRQRFDIVSFDPRGTARSQLADCTIELPAPPTDDTFEARAAFADEIGDRYARACRAQHGALATQIGTNNVARDIDVFRASLGERELNYLGFSYGTILGASYATLFPDRVRAMVLDGNVTPTWLADGLLELDAEGSAGAELALRRLDQLCHAAADCPLKTAGVVAVYDRVIDRLNRDPVVVGGTVVTGAAVTDLVFSALNHELSGWPLIVRVLSLADAGDYSALPAAPTDGGSTMTVPSTIAIMCDDSATRSKGLDYLPAQTGNNAIYPRFGGENFGVVITLCSAWPKTRVSPLTNLTTRNTIVAIGNDFDNRTPMTWSRHMVAALGGKATLVRYQGGGHAVYGSGSACIDGAVESYFRDPTAPPRGLVCPAQPLSFAAGKRAAGVATMAEIVQQLAPKVPALSLRR